MRCHTLGEILLDAGLLTPILNAFTDLGCEVESQSRRFYNTMPKVKVCRTEVVLDDFSVTATENVMMFLAGQTHNINVFMVAQEPSVQNLQAMLVSMGANIQTFPYHHLSIHGNTRSLNGSAEVDDIFRPY